MGKLSDNEKKVITERIRGLATRHLQSGVSTGTRILCHNCGHAKPLIGAVCHGRCRLCNDCALRYELAKAAGDIKSIEDFILAEARIRANHQE